MGLHHIPACLPNSTVALEPSAEAQLPNALALADASRMFNVGKDVPAQPEIP
jgi:hypothetical protein